MSFLPNYCHSFRIIAIPSVLLSFLPYYCHSFRIIVIPSELLSFRIAPNFLPYPKAEKIGRPYLQISADVFYGWSLSLFRSIRVHGQSIMEGFHVVILAEEKNIYYRDVPISVKWGVS